MGRSGGRIMGGGLRAVWDALGEDLADFRDLPGIVRAAVRLMVALVAGGLLGYDRERHGKSAGLRTHMLVAMGAALFFIIPERAGMRLGDLSRVVQGLLTGIGFLGGGAILKADGDRKVHGLTTAAGIWLTAAIGMAAGMGRIGLAVLGTALALIVLAPIHRLEDWIDAHRREPGPPGPA